MRAGLIAAGIVLLLAGGATAQERDAPPPGCRWMGDDLGCRDGRGYYRRTGDGEIIGTYPVSKPKPKPAPRPQPAIPAETPPSAGDVAVAADAVAPAADTPFALNDGGASPAAEAAAAEPALVPPPAPEPAASPPAPAAPKPWWQAFWDWLVNDIMSLLRRLGLAK